MNYSILSKHRSKIMAVAMLWIGFFHSTCWFNNKAVSFFKTNGFGGVDIFLFIFSLGMVYSLKKRDNLVQFYVDRAKRILPYVLPVFLFVCYVNQYDFFKSFLFVHFLDFWSGNNTTLWYVAALPVFVVMAPICVHLLKMKSWKSGLVFLWLSVVAFILFKDKTQMIFASRLPIYFLGFYFGECSYQKSEIKVYHLVVLMVLMVLGVAFLYYNYHHFGSKMWALGLYWYPYVLMTPGICVLGSVVFELIDSKFKKIEQVLHILGSYTLEFYLFHELTIRSVDYLIYWNWDPQGIVRNVFTFALTILIAISYQYLVKKCLRWFKLV